MTSHWISHLEASLASAKIERSKITKEVLDIEGMTGKLTRHFYNNLCSVTDARYLEIGTWRGSSVCSAMCGNSAKIFCIDNWSGFGGPKEEFLENFNKVVGENDAKFIEADCFSLPTENLGKFNIYLYDGGHREEEHYKALTHFINCMDDEFVFVVDDWNWDRVRLGTTRAILELNLEVKWKEEILLTDDGTVTPAPERDQTWWNGIGIFLLKKPNPAEYWGNRKWNPV